ASWCGPCQEEMPAIQAISTSAPADVVFVGVGAKNDKDADAEGFVQKYGITYDVGRDTVGGNNLSGAIERAFGIPGYPSTIVIDADGNVVGTQIGPISTDQLNAYIAAARG
ncbi:MAG TPA: TlpA disulfide reductase family protein, partial [Thermomicrobiales bacterium]|nr:TlpA disulfide reductase family protein [Thermomicrobiales bacterium]